MMIAIRMTRHEHEGRGTPLTAPNNPSASERVEGVFEDALEALAPLAAGARLLLACSAGGDSMALLDLAARHAAARGWALAVVHVDHAQRAESAAEAGFVAEEGARRRAAVFIERLRIGPGGAGALTEDAMRQARHGAFGRAAAAWEAGAVLLAHQADDQAETLLIRLLAGSGPTGLAAIRPVERIAGLTLARPLLEARRADLREYLAARGVAWHDDPTNDDLAAKRSWVRGALLPLVREKIGLDPTARLARCAALIREETETLGAMTEIFLRQLALPAPPPALARLDVAHPLWRAAGAPARRQLLREWLWALRRAPHPPGYAAVGEALAFAEARHPGAELRTVERIYVIHCKTSLMAFAPETPPEARRAAAAPFMPVREEKKSKQPE